ncbi:MAG: adenylosuccinate synthase [Cyclobacteriaceae bacterium]|nr:adenylosuccinate synthase [Cyclobacteriaceae bacterium]
MKADVILGLQWGDEGKGKIVDFLASKYNLIARFQGGPNAGHTLEFENIKHVLHQIPSGIFRSNTRNIIGNGVVLDPVVFKKEIDALKKLDVEPFYNLYISKRAHLIIPTHRILDAALEQSKGDEKIGSTLRGIGPTYQDKIARQGLRVGDVISDDFRKKYNKLKSLHEKQLAYLKFDYDLDPQEKDFLAAVDFLKKFKIVDTEYLLNNALNSQESVLAEGAQGSLLDVDFGSYPFVTSSNTTCAGVCSGLGIPPTKVGQVFGIFKAYCTRVGSGPFPTELKDQTGEELRKAGHEFGATTGRPRRCGWLDLPALKYAVMINGVSQLFMMKSDVLSMFSEIKVCTGYKLKDGTITDTLPFDLCAEEVKPLYQTLPGWKTDLTGIKDYKNLPKELLDYITFIEEDVNVPITIISVGPNRAQTIFKNNHFH